MRRIKIIIAYEGTAYAGFQIQPNAPTIEGVINKTLSECLKEDIKIIGASRTDAGVHALGNVAVFDTESCIEAEKVAIMLNRNLPADIRIMDSAEVAPDFHPRRADCIKTYRYRICNAKTYNPLQRHDAYFYHRPLEIKLMENASKPLIGEHDFESFSSIHRSVQTTVRTIYSLEISRNGDMIDIIVSGNGFLYNMVRIIAGTLIEAGIGKIDAARVKEALETGDRNKAGTTAPACGLTLVEIKYL